MRTIGIVILVCAALAFLFGFSIDTTVATEVGGRRVHNIGLMNEKQNVILLAGALAIVGVVLFGIGSVRQTTVLTPTGTDRQCPHCAEFVKAEAKVCRFCQRDLPSLQHLAAEAEASRKHLAELVATNAEAAKIAEERMPKGVCPNCDKVIPLVSMACKHCGAMFGPKSAWTVRPMSQAS